jgi:hypothetical protein
MDIALGLLKLAALIFAILLVPIAILLATPIVMLWPRPDGITWRQAVSSRYRVVVKRAWTVAHVFSAAIPN